MTGTVESNDYSSSWNDIEIDYSVDGNFDGDLSNVGQADITAIGIDSNQDGTIDTSTSGDVSGVSVSNNGETLLVSLGGAYTLNAGDDVIVEYSDVTNPSSDGSYAVDVAVNTQSTDNPTTASLSIGTGSSGVTVQSSPTTVGDEFTITANTGSGEEVTVENIVDGEVRETVTVTDGGSNDEDGSTDSSVEVTLTAGKSYRANSNVQVTDSNGNTAGQSYSTDNYLVEVDEEVLQGDTTTIEGSIYEFPGELAEGHTIDYSLQYDADLGVTDTTDDMNTIVLADSDVGDGTFVVNSAFDEVDAGGFLNDYPSDGTSVGGANEPGYVVYVDENGGTNDIDSDGNTEATDDDNDGFDVVNTRLDVSATPDPSGPVYGESVDLVDGTVENASGGLGNYEVQFRQPNGGLEKTTTTSGSSGAFAFTAVVDDAGSWTIGTNEGAFIPYQDVEVGAQTPDIEFSTPSTARKNFQTTFSLQLNDTFTDDPIDTGSPNVNGYVNISGPFSSTGTISAGSVTPRDVGGDGTIDYLEVETNANGYAEFQATPTSNAQTATLKGANETATNWPIDLGLEVNNDASDTDASPDYMGSVTNNIGVAQPVNIIGWDVEDGRTSNFDPTAPTTATPDGNEQSIYGDGGPVEIEPLPLADTDAERIVNGLRLGYDKNRGFSEITYYRVTFTLVDQESDSIRPAGSADAPELETIQFVGAGINATATLDVNNADATSIVDNNGDATNVLEVAETGINGEYVAIIRPTEVSEVDEQLDMLVEVDGEGITSLGDTGQPDEINTSGLYVSRFQVDGQTVSDVDGDTTVDLSSQVQNPETSPNVVNNGRVNVTQRQNTGPATIDVIQLDSTDARVSSINNGSYGFDNVDVGPRGLDNDNDGIGEELSQLVFTAYQYADANVDNSLDRDEVNNATVETLPIELNRNLQVDFDQENTSKYSAGQDDLTLTHGVEYQQIAFELTNGDTGEPVNLTDGLFDQYVPLNTYDNAAPGSQNLIHLTDGDGTDLMVELSPAERNGGDSRPGDGYYVIEDIAADGGSDEVFSESGGLNEGDSFAFGSSGTPNSSSSYQLYVETPGRTNATTSDTGNIDVEQPQISLNISGVAGSNVPNSQQDTDGDNTVFDELNHDQTDNFNTNTSAISQASAVQNRTYRFNATLSSATGDHRLNISDFADIVADFDFDGSGADSAGTAMVDGPDVTVFGGGDETFIENENGFFQFDYEANPGALNPGTGSDAVYDVNITVRAYDDNGPNPQPFDGASYESDNGARINTPIAENPVVEVYDENGGELPEPENGTPYNPPFILAQDPVTNNLRIEAFPVDDDDFLLPDGIRFGMTGPAAETNVETTTRSVDQYENTQLATDGYSQGQIGFMSITPTGTGEGIIQLRSGTANTFNPVTVDNESNPIVFDVQRSDRQLNLELDPAQPTAGENFTVTTTDVAAPANESAVGQVTIIVSAPGGDTTTVLTNSNGVAEIDGNFTSGSAGQYTITTRRAGYAPAETQFSVAADLDPANFDVSGLSPMDVNVTQGDLITVSATVTNTGEVSATQTVEFRVDGNVLRSQQLTLDGGESMTIDFQNVDTSSLAAGDYTHGVFTADANQTATLTVEAPTQQHPSGTTQAVFDAVAGQNGDAGTLQRQDILDAVSAYVNDNPVDGETLTRQDILDLVQWYVNN